MFYIILGTKGQFIKMFPIMKLFDKHKVPYLFVHTSQHYEIILENIKLLKVKEPDYYLTQKKADLRNVFDFLKWAPMVLWNARKLTIKKGDYIINHGDTESTLLTFLIGVFFRAKMIHIESGMRSRTYFEPFPEEIIRCIVDNFSDIRFAPYNEDAKNLIIKKKTLVTQGNSVFDAIKMALEISPNGKAVATWKHKRYVVFLVHRKETLMFKERIEVVLETLEMILKKGFSVLWPIHANTKFELRKKGFWEKINIFKSKYDLNISYFYNYVDFVHLLNGCQFAATDGDGVQEESYVLNKPVLILRKVTDSLPGINENVYISYFDIKRVKYFLKNYKKIKRKRMPSVSPSLEIVKYCKKLT